MIELRNKPYYVIMDGVKLAYIGDKGETNYIGGLPSPYGFVDPVTALALGDKYLFQPCGLKSALDGREVFRFETKTPAEVGKLGRMIEKMGGRSYETDIPYVRRLLIDKVLKIKYNGVAYIDVELDDSKGWRKPGEMPLLSYSYSFGGEIKFVYAGGDVSVVSELFEEMFLRRGIHVIAGWNVGFDVTHLSRLLSKKHRVRHYAEWLKHIELIDLRELYMFHRRGIGSYSLDNVAKTEGWGGKARSGKVSAMSREELRNYNMRDVELLLKIEERYGFVERTLKMASELEIPVEDLLTGETVIWEYLILRRLRELGYVAPRKRKQKYERYEGAVVLEPEPGLKRNVAVFDFVSLYPSIIIRDKLDVFGFKGEIVPYYLALFFKKKAIAEEKGDKIGREIYKILMNSCYGMFGYTGSRFYDKSKAEHVTREGRKALQSLVQYLRDIGVKVYAGDTDSVFVDAGFIENVAALESVINNKFHPLQIKLDKQFQTILFLGEQGKGVKKRYIGLTVDGVIVERGVETRRGDWCDYTKRVLRKLAEKILSGASYREVENLLNQFKEELLLGKVSPDELLVTRHLKEELDYKVKPAWVKLWETLCNSGKIPAESREISYWLARDGKVTVDEKEISYVEYWEKQIKPPAMRLLATLKSSLNMSLEQIIGKEVEK
ncbi:MAG: DNA polymerase domain-containing protein [Candidatus Caldarchaeum sp.]